MNLAPLRGIAAGVAFLMAQIPSAGAEWGGSVACIREIMVVMVSIREACETKADPSMTDALYDSIRRLDDFLVAHSDQPDLRGELQDILETTKSNYRLSARDGDTCSFTGTDGEFYQSFMTRMTAPQLRKEIDEFLVQRPADPFGGGCF